jgi:glyceraldehyde-3-phosphate dehydrogenase type I
VHGVWPEKIWHENETLRIGERRIPVFSHSEPGEIPWKPVGAEVVIEATGLFRGRAKALRHLEAGAAKVLISAPSDDADVTIVPGVNDEEYDRERHHVISMASCTTNSLAPVAKLLDTRFGLRFLYVTTVHAYTTSQSLLDKPMRKRRRGRAGAVSMIPTTTGAAKATERVLPGLAGKMDGMAIRVPVPDGSVTDIVAYLESEASVEGLNALFRKAAGEPPLQGILEVAEEELVSVDIVGNPHSAIVDAPATRLLQRRAAKILVWYDNEWGYSSRLVELAARLA